MANIRPWMYRQRLREKNRDILTAHQEHFAEFRSARRAIWGQCWRTMLPLRTTRAESAKRPGGRGIHESLPSKPASAHHERGASTERSWPACLAALGTIVAVFDSAPPNCVYAAAPPFELPMVPSVSGTWTVMVAWEANTNLDSRGPIGPCSARSRSLLSVVAGTRNSFVPARQRKHRIPRLRRPFVPAPLRSSSRHESEYNYSD